MNPVAATRLLNPGAASLPLPPGDAAHEADIYVGTNGHSLVRLVLEAAVIAPGYEPNHLTLWSCAATEETARAALDTVRGRPKDAAVRVHVVDLFLPCVTKEPGNGPATCCGRPSSA